MMQPKPELEDDDKLQDSIEVRAYHLWQQRGRPWGTPELDWFEAESELHSAPPQEAAAADESPITTAAKLVGSVWGSVAGLVSSITDALHSDSDS